MWIRDEKQHRIDQRLELYIRYIRSALEHMRSTFEKAKYIRAGVAQNRDSKPSRYMLPSSLVKSLEHTVMLLIYTARSFEIINRYCKHFEDHIASKEQEEIDNKQLSDVMEELDDVGCTAAIFIEKAQQDIMLMAHTDVDTGVVSYDAVGPEYILATLISNLANRPLDGKEKIDQIYASFSRRLVSNVAPATLREIDFE